MSFLTERSRYSVSTFLFTHFIISQTLNNKVDIFHGELLESEASFIFNTNRRIPSFANSFSKKILEKESTKRSTNALKSMTNNFRPHSSHKKLAYVSLFLFHRVIYTENPHLSYAQLEFIE